jgi:hypothetical protein
MADQCDIKVFEFVDAVYQLQPAVRDHGRQVMEAYSDEFSASPGIQPFGDGLLPGGPIDCLSPYGLTDDDL